MKRKHVPTTALDPFLARLDSELAKEDPAGRAGDLRAQSLATLICLHYKNPKSAFDAWNAMILAGKLEIPIPLWAVDLLEKAALNSIVENTDLGVALGLKGIGKGQTKKSEVWQRVQAHFHETLCMRVRKLISMGIPLTAACHKVANQLERKGIDSLNHSGYKLKKPNWETLQRRYRKWERSCGQEIILMDEAFDALPAASKEEFLKNFG